MSGEPQTKLELNLTDPYYRITISMNLLIRIPFLLEGFIQGLIGSGFSIFLLFILKKIIEYIFSPIIIPYDNNIHFLIILNIILGAMLGLVGSKRAVSKYLP